MSAEPTILHLVTDLRIGGAQRMLLDRVKDGGRFRHAVMVFACETGRSRDREEQRTAVRDLCAEFRSLGVPVHDLGLLTPGEAMRSWMTGRAGRRAADVIRQASPALLHSTLFHAHLLGDLLASRSGLPHVASKEGIDAWMGPVARVMEGRALRRAVRIVAVSRAARRSALGLGVVPHRIRIIPNGISPSRPVDWPIPPPRERGARLFGVGRLDPVKGWPDLLRALSLLRPRHPDLHLDLIGRGPEGPRLRALSDALGLADRVRILTNEEAAATAAGPSGRTGPEETVLVAPSREEGFGLVLLEAMARGFPIVATRVGGIPEVVRNGREALLVPAGCPSALAEAIDRLLGDPRLARRLIEAGRDRLTAFPLDRMVRAYGDLYTEILDGPTRPGDPGAGPRGS